MYDDKSNLLTCLQGRHASILFLFFVYLFIYLFFCFRSFVSIAYRRIRFTYYLLTHTQVLAYSYLDISIYIFIYTYEYFVCILFRSLVYTRRYLCTLFLTRFDYLLVHSEERSTLLPRGCSIKRRISEDLPTRNTMTSLCFIFFSFVFL